eukprot:2309272-Pleurochrysis_carterae.AAC.2
MTWLTSTDPIAAIAATTCATAATATAIKSTTAAATYGDSDATPISSVVFVLPLSSDVLLDVRPRHAYKIINETRACQAGTAAFASSSTKILVVAGESALTPHKQTLRTRNGADQMCMTRSASASVRQNGHRQRHGCLEKQNQHQHRLRGPRPSGTRALCAASTLKAVFTIIGLEIVATAAADSSTSGIVTNNTPLRISLALPHPLYCSANLHWQAKANNYNCIDCAAAGCVFDVFADPSEQVRLARPSCATAIRPSLSKHARSIYSPHVPRLP